jgi:hypothetical protein
MEIRNSTGSKKPESITSQLLLFVAISPREITALALREYSGPNVLFRASSVTLWRGPVTLLPGTVLIAPASG